MFKHLNSGQTRQIIQIALSAFKLLDDRFSKEVSSAKLPTGQQGYPSELHLCLSEEVKAVCMPEWSGRRGPASFFFPMLSK